MWVGVLALSALLLIGSESVWRDKGFMPHVVDTQIYWAMNRSKVYTENNRKKIVIVGTSRAQLGIDPVTLAQELPQYDIVNLAIDGALPLGVIKDLCTDPDFDGLIVADVTIPFLCITEAQATQKEREYVSYYHGEFQTAAAIEKRTNTYLNTTLQSQFVIFSPVLSFKSLLYDRLKPNWLYFHMHLDRYRPAYYNDRMSPAQRKTHKEERINRLTANKIERVQIGKFETIAQNELRELYRTLQNRDGNMVFFRMPTTGEHWDIDEQMAPKTEYWDKLERWSGVPSIHFRDHASTANFDCPDTSHLDAQDVPKFTRSLATLIRQKLNLNDGLAKGRL